MRLGQPVSWHGVPGGAWAENVGGGPKMRRELTAIVLAMTVLAMGFPGASDGPYIDPPDLSWMEAGRTFEYLVDNGTATFQFNVTISDITSSIITYDYWRMVNGSTDVFISTEQHNQTRLDQNISEWYSHIWVNETNLNDGYTTIDTRNFTLDTDPLVVNHVFTNGSTTFTYDEINAYLIKAEYGDGTVIDLLETYVTTDHPGDDLGPFSVVDCGVNEDRHDPEHNVAFYPIVIAETDVCVQEFPDGTCTVTSVAGVQVTWPLWVPMDFKYDLSLHNEDFPVRDFSATLTDIPSGEADEGPASTVEDKGFTGIAKARIWDVTIGVLDTGTVESQTIC